MKFEKLEPGDVFEIEQSGWFVKTPMDERGNDAFQLKPWYPVRITNNPTVNVKELK